MKTKILSAILLLGLGSFTLFAGSVKTEKFKVAGNCGLCKTRIEKAAKSVTGVSEAVWNKDTKIVEVTYDPDETKILKVHEAIAKAGHDTEMVRADDETYASLPGCCKYERLTYTSTGSAETTQGSSADHMH